MRIFVAHNVCRDPADSFLNQRIIFPLIGRVFFTTLQLTSKHYIMKKLILILTTLALVGCSSDDEVPLHEYDCYSCYFDRYINSYAKNYCGSMKELKMQVNNDKRSDVVTVTCTSETNEREYVIYRK